MATSRKPGAGRAEKKKKKKRENNILKASYPFANINGPLVPLFYLPPTGQFPHDNPDPLQVRWRSLLQHLVAAAVVDEFVGGAAAWVGNDTIGKLLNTATD